MTQIKQASDNYRDSAHTWEDKFHKSVMMREKAEKRVTDMENYVSTVMADRD